MRRYSFSPRRGVLLSPRSAEIILGGEAEVPVNLGLEKGYVAGRGDVYEVRVGSEAFFIGRKELRRLLGDDRLLYVEDDESYFVEARVGGHYCKLRYLGEGIWPTLEIDGVHMHNIVGTDPRRDALRKIRLARVGRGHRVLDICTGLGYTAITSLMRGASVTSIELSEAVLWVAEHNPYSRPLVEAEIVVGDAFEVLEGLEGLFDRVIHDPPVFSHAGRLYSGEFYRRVRRVMRPGGVLFHYTGAPGRSRGVDIQRGVARRLRENGFIVERIIRGYGIVARRV